MSAKPMTTNSNNKCAIHCLIMSEQPKKIRYNIESWFLNKNFKWPAGPSTPTKEIYNYLYIDLESKTIWISDTFNYYIDHCNSYMIVESSILKQLNNIFKELKRQNDDKRTL